MLRRALLVMFVAAVCGAFDVIREDELECEEAVARLERCCDEFPSYEVSCVFIAGCNEPDTYPDLSIELADCIQAMDCDDLRAHDLCARIAEDPGIPRTCD